MRVPSSCIDFLVHHFLVSLEASRHHGTYHRHTNMPDEWCCYDVEEEEANDAFEAQAPVCRAINMNEIPSPQKNSCKLP
jgi:hypothetical protein